MLPPRRVWLIEVELVQFSVVYTFAIHLCDPKGVEMVFARTGLPGTKM